MTLKSDSHRLMVLAVFGMLVLGGVLGRTLPHPPNFTPVAALALFAGFLFTRRGLAWAAPLAVMLLSDALFFGFYDPRIMVVVYASLVAPCALGTMLRGRLRARRVGGAVLTMSVLFFTTTNLAVWLFSGMYDLTFSGLATCYAAALPFFKFTLAGDLFWTAVIFGAHAFVRHAGFLKLGTRSGPVPV